jgi:hypothetical protein
MSQILYYRQHWKATLRDRHFCHVCGELALCAAYTEGDDGLILRVRWLCLDHRNWTTPAI